MIMSCVFCSANFEFNTIKCNTIIDFNNKAVGMFSISSINVINILGRITKGLFK